MIFPSAKLNYVYVVFSVALVLFLLGFFGMALLQTQQIGAYFKEKVNIIVELENNRADESLSTLHKHLSNSRYIKDTSFQFISKEEGAKMLIQEFGEDFLKMDMPNPLYDVLTFHVKASYLNQDSLKQVRRDLKRYPFISDVYFQETFVNELARNLQQIGYIALGISLIFIIIAVTLIHNTVRLALYANRFLIKNMELVGASWEFISRPYLLQSAWHGFLSALLAISGLIILTWLISNQLGGISIKENVWRTAILFIGLILSGMLIMTASTYYVINKYLSMRVDDLY